MRADARSAVRPPARSRGRASRRKVPRDLTEATLAGGGLSLISTVVMAYLFISNIAQYLATTHSTTIVLDRSEDKRLQINFNLTLPHLPCQFASVDVSDVMGTQILNVSRSVQKHQIDGEGRFIGMVADRAKELRYAQPLRDGGAQAGGHSVSVADVAELSAVVGKSDLVLVNFYAPWCPWSQRLAPVWEEAAEELAAKPYAHAVAMAKVDCTSAAAQELCRAQHVRAFPSIRIYRDGVPHSQESYMADRTHEALLAFVEKNLPAAASATGERALPFWEQPEIELHGPHGLDGCVLSGSLLVNRVPGNFHVSAHSPSASVHMPLLNLSHVVHHLSFGRPLSLDQFGALPAEVAAAWNPLHGAGFIARGPNVTIEHYLKVVHTSYEPQRDEASHVRTYQYTIHSHQYEDPTAYPALLFSYELAAVEVIVRRERQSLAAFLTQVCAIVGGVFTVTGLVRARARRQTSARPPTRAAAPRAPAVRAPRLTRLPVLRASLCSGGRCCLPRRPNRAAQDGPGQVTLTRRGAPYSAVHV